MKKKVTVSGKWIDEVFVGNEKEVFRYLTDIKARQFNMLNDALKKEYKYAHSNSGREADILKVRENIAASNPDIGVKITITNHTSFETKFF